MPQSRSTPCHLITGPLGVGKTTAIIDYLKRHAHDQFVAVLVNDFGPVGMDAAIMEGDLASATQRPKLVMVPGGCICCSAAAGVVGALQELSQLPHLDRIIIEPSGLALVGDMLDLLSSVQAKFSLDIRPVITLLDPRLLDRAGFRHAPYYVRMVEGADVLVANRCDLVGPERIEAFRQWAADLYPPKLRIIDTHHGQLPDEVFDLRHETIRAQFTPADERQILPLSPDRTARTRMPHVDGHSAGGLQLEASLRFRAEPLEDAMEQVAARGFQGAQIARLKAILHTDEGWKLIEIASGDVYSRPTDYRRDNRLDWIAVNRAASADEIRAWLMTLTVNTAP